MLISHYLRFITPLMGVFLVNLASAQVPLRITHSDQDYPIAPVCRFSLASQDSLPPPDQHFKTFDATRLDIHSENDYWYQFTVQNLNPSPLYLVIEPSLYASVRLYESTANGLRFLGKAGLDESTRQENILNNRHIFPLPLPTGQQRAYLLRLNRCWIKSLPVRVVSQKALINTMQTHDLADGLLLGVLIGIVLFLFILYGLSQEADYGWLGLFLGLALIQELIGKGYIFTYFPLPDPQWHTALLLMTTGLSGIVSLRFTHSFLRLNDYPLRIRQGYRLAVAGYAFFLLMAIARYYPLFHWQTAYVIIIYFLSLLLTAYAIRRGHREARYFIAPLLVPLLFLPLLMADRQGYGSEGDAQGLYLLMLVCSALLYSLAVGYKVKVYRDQTKQLVHEQNLKLEATVTERTAELHMDKQRLERQSRQLALAMQELNHRVKNNLSIVTSLLNLQGQQIQAPSVQRVLADSRQRIEVLSLLHQQLYKSDELTAIDLSVYLRSLIDQVQEAYGYTAEMLDMNLVIPAVVVPTEQALPLGLLLNEVMTNAFKHAIPRTPRPRLSVTLQCEPTQWLLDIGDNGPGLTTERWAAQTESFGKKLIDGLTYQLNGHYEVIQQGGTLFRFAMPPSLPLS